MNSVSYADLNLDACVANLNNENSKLLSNKLFENVTCTICQEIMFKPFMTNCGHTFCYSCLDEWLENKMTCPVCRTQIKQIPVLNHSISSLVGIVTDCIIQDSKDPEIMRQRILELQIDRNHTLTNVLKLRKKLFRGRFDNMVESVIDTSDGVRRCGYCHWEVEGRNCSNCGRTLVGENSDYDSDGEDLDSNDENLTYYGLRHYGSDYDGEDSDDAHFVDDRPLSEILGDESDAADDSYDSDNDVSSGMGVEGMIPHYTISDDSDESDGNSGNNVRSGPQFSVNRGSRRSRVRILNDSDSSDEYMEPSDNEPIVSRRSNRVVHVLDDDEEEQTSSNNDQQSEDDDQIHEHTDDESGASMQYSSAAEDETGGNSDAFEGFSSGGDYDNEGYDSSD